MNTIKCLIASSLLVLGACSGHQVQLTSGADYLSRYAAPEPASPVVAAVGFKEPTRRPATIDEQVREAAAIEPILEFPARIGIARIHRGRLTTVPAEEAGIWAALAEDYRAIGTFVPVQPVIAESTARAIRAGTDGRYRGNSDDVVSTIRLGAARQHLDAVLIYETGVTARKEATGLAFADITIIGGAFLPTRSIEVEGRGSALLLDVRNGYPYGTAQTSVDLSRLSPSWGSDDRMEELRSEASLQVAEKLVPEVNLMFRDLLAAYSARPVAN